MDNQNKANALQALKESDGWRLLLQALEDQGDEYMSMFIGTLDPEAYDKQFTKLHILQAQIRGLMEVKDILEEIINENTVIEQDDIEELD